ncbi:uncharacterized protein MONBRDRAFT_5835 [Monosiga brevicollis MX1]|uniref:DNA-directed RNA polymerases I, II, and III subunit RPABC1 n=1 Tax=Monosiga brevicollis TaxID=81824 RepID=A9USL7_MONBE|nr:uncharacterized protein MONBRDRAFT_5835 [Monosiga brevicollis MX1]EDQ91802.1 predicted protein [Monosiga brevicollis MX1]|eukprot:XP_001743088.1 hypothetical protein [Monosiga brevicollis MX1]
MAEEALNQSLLYRLWRVRVTLAQLCQDRGYDVKSEDLLLTREGFAERFGSQPLNEQPRRSDLDFVVQRASDPTDQLGVYFANDPKVGIAVVRDFFEEKELVVNVTKHELVPKHFLQTPEEKAALLERYKLKEQQLPRIKVTDPIARYLGLKRGQVVKIIRENSPTAGRYVSYRLVF